MYANALASWRGHPFVRRFSRTLGEVMAYVILAVGAIVMVLPFVWMISTSLKEAGEVFSYPPRLIPSHLAFHNYVDAWRAAPFGRYFFNSLFVATSVTLGQLISCSLAAYAFARMNFPGKALLFTAFLSTLMIPRQITLIPSFLVLRELHWLDTYYALIVPFIASAFGTFMLRQTFMSIPRELEDAAKLDGCSRLGFLWRVMLPLSRPTLASLALFTFMGNWNSYLWPLIMTNSQKMRTLQIGLRFLVCQEGGTNWGMLMAATVVVSIPILIFYLFVQKQFVESLTFTGIGG
ncbi:MAG TPA: carbohydrate ABC transporter permease [Chloroflexi bacterium]|nr:carbohydrate ABC transporter permease [Chloroflexota bacterium]